MPARNSDEFYSHVRPDIRCLEHPKSRWIKEHVPNCGCEWRLLRDHLQAVAEHAAEYLEPVGLADLGYNAGLYHDLGKYNPAFQRRLDGDKRRVVHAGPGFEYLNGKGDGESIVAHCIRSHHGALKDPGALLNHRGGGELEASLHGLKELPPLRSFEISSDLSEFFLTKLVFSALVDADSLDAEAFHKGPRRNEAFDFPHLLNLLESAIEAKERNATSSDLNLARSQVGLQAKEAAYKDRGLYTLEVPTGGGKTLSMMRFALHHAIHHKMRRIVVVLPYTAIISQNAEVYRQIFGADKVLEHHSSFDVSTLEGKKNDLDQEEESLALYESSSENWDVPIIVTTTVRLFDAIYGASKAKLRRLHNLINSVVIFDEAQVFPPDLMGPVLKGFRFLLDMGSTVVMSTATQPLLRKSRHSYMQKVLPPATPIIYGLDLENRLSRVETRFINDLQPIPNENLVKEVVQHPCCLVITHTRKDAVDIHSKLSQHGGIVYFLSAALCSKHKMDVIQSITRDLRKGKPVRVVSTQLIEAGVDLDFPVVFRAFAGFDSLVQSAGRCNREFKAHKGKFFVYVSESKIPIREIEGLKGWMIRESLKYGDIFDPSLMGAYFDRLYSGFETKWRDFDTLACRRKQGEYDRKFKLISNDTISIVVPYDIEPIDFVEPYSRNRRRNNQVYRKVQPYSVSVYKYKLRGYESFFVSHPLGLTLLCSGSDLYDPTYGLDLYRKEGM